MILYYFCYKNYFKPLLWYLSINSFLLLSGVIKKPFEA